MRRAHGCAQRAVLSRVAVYRMPFYELEHESRSSTGQRIHARTEIGAEIALDRVGIDLEAGIDLTAVASGGAPNPGSSASSKTTATPRPPDARPWTGR